MPAETPEQSAMAARRVSLGCLSILMVGVTLLAGWSLWGLATGHHLRLSGWTYIFAFVISVPGFIRLTRKARKPRPGR